VTPGSSQTTTQWSDFLLRALVELRQVFSAAEAQLDDTAREDFSRLFDGARRLEEMLGQAGDTIDSHDLMNILAAIRGYAEILREDVGPQQAELDDTLARLLQALHTAQDGGKSSEAPQDTRIIGAQPHPHRSFRGDRCQRGRSPAGAGTE
jgi:signal transduction histidine kinase